MNNIILKSYTELFERDEELAKELLKKVGKGAWQENEIFYHANLKMKVSEIPMLSRVGFHRNMKFSMN